MSKKRAVAIFAALLVAGVLLGLIAPRWRHFWAVDDCLDSGGRWAPKLDRCEH